MAKMKWNWEFGGGSVAAYTKGEARALIKRIFNGPIPKGLTITRGKRANISAIPQLSELSIESGQSAIGQSTQ